MAQAAKHNSTPLSSIIRDPLVRAAFQRAERDHGGPEPMAPALVEHPPKPPQSGGAWVEVDDIEQTVYVDLDCTRVPNLTAFVRACHELAGELGYGIIFNETVSEPVLALHSAPRKAVLA